MQQLQPTSLQPSQQVKTVNGSRPSPPPPHASAQPPPLPPAAAMAAAAVGPGGLAYPTSSFSPYQSRLNSRLQSVFSASSELLLSEDGNVARLYEALEQWYLASDQALLHLMDADALLTIYESEPFQSSLPLTLSSLLPLYHTLPAQLMQQQQQALHKMRLRHQLLAQVSVDYLPQPASPHAASDPQQLHTAASALTATSPPASADQSPSMPSLSSPPLPSSPPVAAKVEEKKERERADEINLVDDEPAVQQQTSAAAAAAQASGDGAMELESTVSAPESMQEARSIMDLTNS